ncbi:flagellar basal body rod protein [Alicyclobacillaceae bacterium I2511]|nr:flagellar basal body rod protein [Alicyclobacillaceae bacterium I2511]
MLRGTTDVASALLALQNYQQLLANNLTNLETPGFKASAGELLSFPEQLVRLAGNPPGTPPPLGGVGTGVTFQEGVPSFAQGSLTTTGRNLDVGISDNTPQGPYGEVVTATGAGNATGAGTLSTRPGPVTLAANGFYQLGGQNLAVVNAQGQALAGVFAAKNPAYQGSTLVGANGSPAYDANGQPSYRFVNAKGQLLGVPGTGAWQTSGGWVGAALHIGTSADMGWHSFFPVAFHAANGQVGVALTRDGHFQVNAQNQLLDANGNPVLPVNAQGRTLLGATLVVNPAYRGQDLFGHNGQALTDANGQLSYRVVNAQGAVLPAGTAHLGTVNADVSQLNPLGQGEWQVAGTHTPASVLARLQVGTGSLHPGQLEQSNVNATSTMVDMTAAVGLYQMNVQALQEINQTLSLAVSDVGKVT